MTVSSDIDLSVLLADTEAEILRVVADRDAVDRRRLRDDPLPPGPRRRRTGPRGKRMRPLLGPPRLHVDRRRAHAARCPAPPPSSSGHNFSLVHDDIEDGDVERRHRPTLWTLHGVPQAINTGDLIFSLSRVALHRLTDLGFSDAKVLRLMRLYDETCVMLCEGQYLDIATSASDEPMTVELYFDMIGRKTAALISGSIEAGALLATDDDEVIARYRRFGWALGPRVPAQRRPAGHLGPGGRRRARCPRTSRATRRRCPCCTRSSTRRPADRARLPDLYRADDPAEAEVAEIVAILERAGAREFTRDEAQRWRDDAPRRARRPRASSTRAAREQLRGIITSVISRLTGYSLPSPRVRVAADSS